MRFGDTIFFIALPCEEVVAQHQVAKTQNRHIAYRDVVNKPKTGNI
jgi:hypothetical protein